MLLLLSDLTLTDISEMEGLLPKQFGTDAKELPGARRLLANLDSASAPWAIVTSGTRPLVTGVSDILGANCSSSNEQTSPETMPRDSPLVLSMKTC